MPQQEEGMHEKDPAHGMVSPEMDLKILRKYSSYLLREYVSVCHPSGHCRRNDQERSSCN